MTDTATTVVPAGSAAVAAAATPSAPANPTPAVVAAQQAAAQTTGTVAAEDAQAQRVEDLPEWAQRQIRDARAEAAASRVNAKAAAAAEAEAALTQKIGRAIGVIKDDEPVTPEQLVTQAQTAREEANQARLELAAYRAAQTAGVDPAALLDSYSFREQLRTIDPADSEALAAAIATAATVNPNLTLRTAQAAQVGSADLTGRTGTVRTFTAAQIGDPAFFQANRAAILLAQREGRITP